MIRIGQFKEGETGQGGQRGVGERDWAGASGERLGRWWVVAVGERTRLG